MEQLKTYSMIPSLRWYGPHDLVSLEDIRQTGYKGVVTALHYIPPGEVWSQEAIQSRSNMLKEKGLNWEVVESLPVHESIKRNAPDRDEYIENYKESLVNLAAGGPKVITYNFMPVLDWVRTNTQFLLPNGAEALQFDYLALVAFDLFQLQRKEASSHYAQKELKRAEIYFGKLSKNEKEVLKKSMLQALPGTDEAFSLGQLKEDIAAYMEISREQLRANLIYFLQEICPLADELGLKLSIHPDDPPFSVLGLPRVVCSPEDLKILFDSVPSKSNGLCFCTGSLGASPNNDLLAMLEAFSDRIHFLHLRNVKRMSKDVFYESGHIEGDVPMVKVIQKTLEIMKRRQCNIPMRPDHGHKMLGDIDKDFYPGYSFIGRLKGLSELKGIESALL